MTDKEAMSRPAYLPCDHLCLRGSDVGVSVPGDPVAYAHPGCPVHGHCEAYVPGEDIHSNGDRPCINCRAYEDEHNYTAPGDEPDTATEFTGDACGKCGTPMTLFDGTWAHSNVFDMLTCTGVKVVPGGPAKITSEDFAARMAERSRKALESKDHGTT